VIVFIIYLKIQVVYMVMLLTLVMLVILVVNLYRAQPMVLVHLQHLINGIIYVWG
jgi:hypothetical protein